MACQKSIVSTYKSRRNRDIWVTAPRIKSENGNHYSSPRIKTEIPEATAVPEDVVPKKNIQQNYAAALSKEGDPKLASKISHLMVPSIPRKADVPRTSSPLPIENMTEINKEEYRNSYLAWRNYISEHTSNNLFIVRGARWMAGEFISGHIMSPIENDSESDVDVSDEDEHLNNLLLNQQIRKDRKNEMVSTDTDPLIPKKEKSGFQHLKWASSKICYRLCNCKKNTSSDSEDVGYTIDKNGYAIKNLSTIRPQYKH